MAEEKNESCCVVVLCGSDSSENCCVKVVKCDGDDAEELKTALRKWCKDADECCG